MNRRSFLNRSLLAATSLPAVTLLNGCGDSGEAATTPIDGVVSDLARAQLASDELHLELGRETDLLISSTPAANAAARLGGDASHATATTAGFFASALPSFSATSPVAALYLEKHGEKTMWEHYRSSHVLAKEQFNHQYTKLLAALRTVGYRLQDKNPAETQTAARAAAFAAQRNLSESDQDTIDAFRSLLVHVTEETPDPSKLDLITDALDALREMIGSLLDSDRLKAISYAVLTYFAVGELLKLLQEKLTSDLAFTTQTETMLSLAKMSIAAIAFLGSISIGRLTPAASAAQRSAAEAPGTPETNEEELTAFLQGVSAQSQLVLLMMQLVTQLLTDTVAATQAQTRTLLDSLKNGEDGEEPYTLSEEDETLVETLKNRSRMLATIALVMKALFALLSEQATDSLEKTLGFDPQGDASLFSMLFGEQPDPYDEAFSAYMYENLQSIYGAQSSYADIIAELSDQALRFSVATEQDAFDFTTRTEEDAFTFASMLARLAYNFTSQTESDAFAFTSNMAEMAYNFTMKIEDDAYHFAMQGMEYGYLFASRGEDVGLMADRILWMAVQIGQMADRIGEMADRIVYTEQLIVYTEMLILNFGLLIYGGMTQITNLMLTGVALALDRKWYHPKTEDQIVTLIGETMLHMMDNMQSYSLAVLENQSTLREITLEALEWISGEY